MPPEAERAWWYQYYFATERGRAGYDAYRRDFARLIWRPVAPITKFSQLEAGLVAGKKAFPSW